MTKGPQKPQPPDDRGDRFVWKEGDIEILHEGTGEPLISPEQLERIIAENRKRKAQRR